MLNHSETDQVKRSVLDTLPPDLIRKRVLDTPNSCEFLGVSIAQWRRLRVLKEAPEPIMLGKRKHGWAIGTLIDWQESRQRRVSVAA